MDLDGLFWIALIVFYFLARVIGGGKRSNQTGQKQPQETRGNASRGGNDELSVALDEIRRALGYRDAEESEMSTPEEAQHASRQEQRTAQDAATASTPDALPPAKRRSSDSTRAGGQRSPSEPHRRTKEQRTKKRDAEARTRPRIVSQTKLQTTSRTRSSSSKKRSRPEIGDKIVPGLPELESSFAEEEAFERVGRHPHRVRRHDLQVVSPYEEPARKQLPGVRRRLSKRASLREAFLIKEILDRPVSMRRR